jgi:hypothetical protein
MLCHEKPHPPNNQPEKIKSSRLKANILRLSELAWNIKTVYIPCYTDKLSPIANALLL